MKINYLSKYKVAVRAEAVQADVDGMLIQYHRFPGTFSIVAHASLNGFELAVATSPCVDPRNFLASIGEYYAGIKVAQLATDKLWEIHGIGLRQLLKFRTESEDEFYEKYKDIYKFTPIEEVTAYQEPTLPTA